MNVKRILMPTDFSECSDAALDHALFLAGHFDADLDLLHVVVLHNLEAYEAAEAFPAGDEIYSRLQEIASGEMKELLEGHRGRLRTREVRRRAIAAAPEIVAYAEEEDVDLIVMGAHGRRGFRRFLLGSVTEEVVRVAPCPVLTMRGQGQASELHRWRRILVPFDFSEPARNALAAARELAVSQGGLLHVVHVVEPIMEPHPYVPAHYRSGAFDLPQLVARVRQDLDSIVAEAAGSDVEYDVDVLEGKPAWRIPEHAESIAADLIVIATHGRTGLSRFFLGSVTERVVRGAGCPVLTLKYGAPEP